MRNFLCIALLFLTWPCESNSEVDKEGLMQNPTNKQKAYENEQKIDKDTALLNIVEGFNEDLFQQMLNEPSEYATFHIVCLDSGKNYSSLNKSMYSNAKINNIKIDTANRSYNKEKDLIALAEDDEDEMYAGEYYPRRFPAVYLSLEYLNYYNSTINEKTIGLIAGIFEDKSKADNLLKELNPSNPNAFVMKGKVYTGCMH